MEPTLRIDTMEIENSVLQSVANVAEYANAVASMVVGHRRILVEGGFDVNLADQMAAALHAQVLGLAGQWEEEPNHEMFIVAYPNDEEEDE
jgi:predicted regulator of Ras-like GTPase activity (Roadblock/LC7/MglB family)